MCCVLQVIVEYFDFLYILTVSIFVQYQFLCEVSQKYQFGFQFGVFVRSVFMFFINILMKEDVFVFELFIFLRYIQLYYFCTLYIVGCRVQVNILCENYEKLDNCINFCFRESQRKISGQSIGLFNDFQLQDEFLFMGRNGIFCNLVYRVKRIRNRFFEMLFIFLFKKNLYFFFCFLSIIYLKIISGGLFF